MKINDIQTIILLLCFFGVQLYTGITRGILLVLLAVMVLIYCLRKGNAITIAFLLLVFQNALQRISRGTGYFQVITYYDEVIALLVLLCVLVWGKGRIRFVSKYDRMIIPAFLIYVLFGMISSIGYGKVSILTVFMDIFVCSKFMIFYIGGQMLSARNILSREKVYKLLNRPCQYIATFLFLFAVHDLFFNPFFEKRDYRIFTYSLQLCFEHPTYLAASCFFCVAILMMCMRFEKKNMIYIIMLSIVAFLTFRAKAIVGVFAVFAIYFAFVKYKVPAKGLFLFVIAVIGVYLGMDQVKTYFTVYHTYIPIRLKLLRDGLFIAKEFFPLGAGFGTFGTTVAFDSGSSFYYKLGYMNGYYENQPVGDAFWPGVIAEAGWIGTVFFIACVLGLVFEAVARVNKDKYGGWSMLSVFAYAIISSTSETAFFNPAIAVMFIAAGIACGSRPHITELRV